MFPLIFAIILPTLDLASHSSTPKPGLSEPPPCSTRSFTSHPASPAGGRDTSPALTEFSFVFRSCTGQGEWAQALYCLKNGPEQLSRHRYLRHLENHLPGMAHHF